MLNSFDWIVVGAGMTGAAFARIRAERGDRVLVVDKRDHIGGNCHDRFVSNFGLRHMYGPHLFHTNSQEVVNFLTRFTHWRPYEHRVLVSVSGQQVPLPVNFDTIEMLFPKATAANIIDTLNARCLATNRTLSLFDLEKLIATYDYNGYLAELYKVVYHNIFKPYTEKHWGTPIEKVAESTLKRVPIRLNYDDRYFSDNFQYLPTDGYTEMFRKMLHHESIQTMTSTNWSSLEPHWDPRSTRVLFTGSIDEFYNYEYGALPYRSVIFEDHFGKPLNAGTLNLPSDLNFTRVTDQSIINNHTQSIHMHTYERPLAYVHNDVNSIPYYPVANEESKILYERYSALNAEKGNVLFAGRLGSFQYLNIDQACAQGMKMAQNIKDIL